MSKEAMTLALEKIAEALPAYIDGVASREYLSVIHEALAKQEQGEPVAFLAKGTRFKISYDTRQSGGQIHGIPPELGGRWVAFVAADDDCHLKLTTPQPAQKPLTDVLLSDEVIEKAGREWWAQTRRTNGPRTLNQYASQRIMDEVRNTAAIIIAEAIKAAHGIKD